MMMQNKLMCAVALGCAAVMGLGTASAQMSGTSASGSNMGSDQDKQFLQEAATSDFTEIKFSQLAAQKASSSDVKAYANKMITDHQMLEQKMQPVAQQMGVTPPTDLDSQHQQLYDQLNQLSGADFDKQYMSDMSTDHHKALDLFKQEESSTQNAQLKPLVKQGEKVVAQHTAMADKMVKKMGGTAAGM
jgi:putative membrane protein